MDILYWFSQTIQMIIILLFILAVVYITLDKKKDTYSKRVYK